MNRSFFIADENAMLEFGARLANGFPVRAMIFLQGDLGAGKSTLVRGFIQGCGYSGRVKSPTYTLIEPYQAGEKNLYHLDLYRLADPEELEYIGIRDMLAEDSICLVEWPEKAGVYLNEPDIHIKINHLKDGRELEISANDKDFAEIIKAL